VLILEKSIHTNTRKKRVHLQILYREISSCAVAACCEEMRKGGWKMALEWQGGTQDAVEGGIAISSDGTACYSGRYSLRYPQRHRVQILCE